MHSVRQSKVSSLPASLPASALPFAGRGLPLWSAEARRATLQTFSEGASRTSLRLGRSPEMRASVMVHTVVDPAWFQERPQPLGVSGGTAAFYHLKLRSDLSEQRGSAAYYIGKDISHAKAEVDFYEEVQVNAAKDGGLRPLFKFMLEYAGVVSFPAQGMEQAGAPSLELLVLRNLFDGSSKLRMLDVKIGQWTASANWKGKSRVRALRQGIVDSFTNSYKEGFRLEGVDGASLALASMCPKSDTEDPRSRRKAFRKMCQQLRCADVIMHFLDIHQMPEDPDEARLEHVHAPIEVAEAVLLEVSRQLASLAVACRRAPAPQKWIGSSVALGFDAGSLPPRKRGMGWRAELSRASGARVTLFDWGRSELNTAERHCQLSPAMASNYAMFWGYYIDGVDRLSWETARAYRHRFGNHRGWKEVLVMVVCLFAEGENEVLGQARIPIESTKETTLPISSEGASLSYSVEWQTFPTGFELLGAWRIRVLRASGLRRQGQAAAVGVFCELVAVAEANSEGPSFGSSQALTPLGKHPGGSHVSTFTMLTQASTHSFASSRSHDGRGANGDPLSFRQVTSVQRGSTDPEWEETLELPVASRPNALEETLAGVCPQITEGGIGRVLPCGDRPLEVQARFPAAEGKAAGSGSEDEVGSGEDAPSMASRRSMIHLGDVLDDDASLQDWASRLDRAGLSDWGDAASPASVRRDDTKTRLARGAALLTVHQATVLVRAAAIFAVVASFTLAITLLLWEILLALSLTHGLFGGAVAEAEFSFYKFLGVVLISPLQMLLGPMAVLFEMRPERVKSIGLEGFQDWLMDHCLLRKLFTRGCFYIGQGALWLLCSFFLQVPTIIFWSLAMGVDLCAVGALLLAAHYGLLRRHHTLKVMRHSPTKGGSHANRPPSASNASSWARRRRSSATPSQVDSEGRRASRRRSSATPSQADSERRRRSRRRSDGKESPLAKDSSTRARQASRSDSATGEDSPPSDAASSAAWASEVLVPVPVPAASPASAASAAKGRGAGASELRRVRLAEESLAARSPRPTALSVGTEVELASSPQRASRRGSSLTTGPLAIPLAPR